MARKVYYFDMDGVLANFHKEKYQYVNAINREWIASLDPFVDNVNLVRSMVQMGKSVYILSKAASDGARLGKMDWIHKYIPELKDSRVIIMVSGQGSSKKSMHARTKTGILIDDDPRNIREWEKSGRIGVLVETKGGKISLC